MVDTQQEKFTFFWDGPFSQWCESPFTLGNINFNRAEQYMMYQKAMLFKDPQAALAILLSNDPEEQKALGRKVEGYTDERWHRTMQMNDKPLCWNIVYDGNIAKFTQNKGLRGELLKTRGTTLVEASPTDQIWGIGLKASDPRAQIKSEWLGKNWLGEVLTVVRDSLIWAGF